LKVIEWVLQGDESSVYSVKRIYWKPIMRNYNLYNLNCPTEV